MNESDPLTGGAKNKYSRLTITKMLNNVSKLKIAMRLNNLVRPNEGIETSRTPVVG